LQVRGAAVGDGHDLFGGFGLPQDSGLTGGLDDRVARIFMLQCQEDRFDGEEPVRMGHSGGAERLRGVRKARA